MGRVSSAPFALALIRYAEPSSVWFRRRRPKQGELITAAPGFGQVASRPPDIHAGQTGPLAEFLLEGLLIVCRQAVGDSNRSAKVFWEYDNLETKRAVWVLETVKGLTVVGFRICIYVYI